MKFSIITPVRNMERWVSQTIDSILLQAGDFEIEYIIVDGCSTDRTRDILHAYEQDIINGIYPTRCHGISFHILAQEGRNGMYDAVNQGFQIATGDIFAYLNADDLYAPGTFESIASIFEKHRDTMWLKGKNVAIDEDGRQINAGKARLYNQAWIREGMYGMQAYYIEQDSVFWRSKLWELGGPIPSRYRLAGDYWLWKSFARFYPLWTLNKVVSFYRKRPGQLGKQTFAYKNEQKDIQSTPSIRATMVRLFFSLHAHLTKMFPRLNSLFTKLYPCLFPLNGAEYLEPKDVTFEKRMFRSFEIS